MSQPPSRAVESAAYSCGGSRGFVHRFPCMQVAVHTSAPTAFPVESLTGTTGNTLASAWSDGQEKFNIRYLGEVCIKNTQGRYVLKVASGASPAPQNRQCECSALPSNLKPVRLSSMTIMGTAVRPFGCLVASIDRTRRELEISAVAVCSRSGNQQADREQRARRSSPTWPESSLTVSY